MCKAKKIITHMSVALVLLVASTAFAQDPETRKITWTYRPDVVLNLHNRRRHCGNRGEPQRRCLGFCQIPHKP